MTSIATRIAINTCMDPRLTPFVDNQKGALVYRTAGGFLGPNKHDIKERIRLGKLNGVHNFTHDKCGAIKFISSVIRDEIRVDQELYDRVVKPFIKFEAQIKKNSDLLQKLESLALYMQKEVLQGLPSVECAKIDTLNLGTPAVPKEGRVLAVCLPLYTDRMNFTYLATSAGLDPSRTFFITLGTKDEDIHQRMMTDAKISTQLSMERIMLFKDHRHDNGVIDKFRELLRTQNLGLPISQKEYIT